MPKTVNDATKHATQKHHHHHRGVFPSAMPQIFSVIHEKLRLLATNGARGRWAGATSAIIAGGVTEASSTWDISWLLQVLRRARCRHGHRAYSLRHSPRLRPGCHFSAAIPCG